MSTSRNRKNNNGGPEVIKVGPYFTVLENILGWTCEF